MNTAGYKSINKLFVILMAIIMAVAMLPVSPVYAEGSTYDYQPENAKQNDTNSLKMTTPSDITFLKKENGKYVNQINGTLDGSSDSGISFSFSLTAGMGTFSETNFIERNMPQISIYDAEGNVAARYSDGNGSLKYLGNDNSTGVRILEVGVDQGVLDSGDYTIVFGKDICGNNTSKTLGSDIVFQFTVKASGDLEAMIEKAEAFLASVQVTDGEPGGYPAEARTALQTAIVKAEGVLNSGSGDTEQASEELYQALKTFKNSRIIQINNITISGISDTLSVGDSGKVSAEVSVEPNEAQYKKVTWSVVKDNTTNEPADNLILDSETGEWIAAYNGTVYVKAASASNPEKIEYKKVTISSPEGSVAVNKTDETDTLEELINKTGISGKDITSVKVYTSGSCKLSDTDVAYLNGLTNLQILDLGNAYLAGIGEKAFEGHRNLTTAVLPDTVASIGSYAFRDCPKLKNIDIPFSVSSLGSGIFDGCTSLNSTLKVMAAAPPALSEGASLGGTINNIMVPNSCAKDYEAADGWKNYKIEEGKENELEVKVSTPGALEAVANKALKDQNLTEKEVTKLVITGQPGVYLERATDMDSYLKNHFLNATTIDLRGIKLQDNKWFANTFKDRINLKLIYLPKTTVNIGKFSFYGCINLREMEIPPGVTAIHENAFGGCTRLNKSVVINAVDPPDSYGSSFPYRVSTIIVPPGSVDAYEASYNWSEFHIMPQYSLSLSSSSLLVEALKSVTLTADVTIYGSCGDTVFWESSNTGVATVSQKTGKTVTINGIKAGTAVITAKDTSGTVTATCKVTVSNLFAPTVSTSSSAYNSVRVSWSGVEGAQKYIVRRCKSNGAILKTWTLGSTARSLTDTGLTTGTAYYYKVQGYKAVNGTSYYGDYSTLKAGVPTLTRPATPSVSRASKTYVKVKWKGISGETGYQVYRASSLNGKYSRVKSVKMASAKYPYAKIKTKRKVTYYYKVRAYKTIGGRTVYSSFSGARAYRLK